MVAYATLALLAAMVAATRLAPTADEMQAAFQTAQKFYSSGAYDQAIERYQHIISSRSRFLDMSAVQVTVGDITAPLHEVAPYQIGNAHFRMAEDALQVATQARTPEEQTSNLREAAAAFDEAARSFVVAESLATVPTLRALSRSQAITCWYKNKEYEQAIEGSRLLLQRYPDSKYVEKALYDIGWSYYDMKDYLHSLEALQELVQRFPQGYRASRALFQIGEAYYELGRYAEAIPFYQRLVESQRIGKMTEREILLMKREKIAGLVDETALELAAKALIRTGMCYEKTGQYDMAGEAFNTVATQFADERRLAEEAYLRQADMHYTRGDFEGCIAVYRRAIEAEQDQFRRARLQLLLANRYFDTEHYAEAVREYGVYRETYPMQAAQAGLSVEGAGLKMGRAWIREAGRHPEQERLDYYRRAEAELRQTLSAYPGSAFEIELRFNLGLAIQLQADQTRANEALQLFRSVADHPNSRGYRKSALFQVARILQEQNDLTGAAQGYRELLAEMAPDDEELEVARFELGAVQRQSGAWQEAVDAFVSLGPGGKLFARSRLEAGQTLLQQGLSERAIAVLSEGAADSSDARTTAYLKYFLGAALSRLERYPEALPQFNAAAEAGIPEITERALYGRAATYMKLTRYEEAIADLRHPWTDPELIASAPRLLATAYTATNRTDEALAVYQQLADQTQTPLERAELLLAQAEIAYRRERYAETVVIAQRLQVLDFDEKELPEGRAYYLKEKAGFLIADASVRTEDFARAVAAADAGLAAYPKGFYAPDLLFLGALAALQLDKAEETVTRLTRLLEVYPGTITAPYAHYYLGYAHYNQTEFAPAREQFSLVAERYPDLDIASDALFRSAECRYNQGEYALAEAVYREMLRRFPEHALAEDALFNIAWCSMNAVPAAERERQTEALRGALNAYLAKYPHGRHAAAARYTVAEIHFNEGDYNRAYELFRVIETEYDGQQVAQDAAAMLPELQEAIAFKDYGQVMEAMTQAIDADDNSRLPEVVAKLTDVWKRFPDTAVGIGAQVNIGVCYQRLKQWQDAVAAYDLVIAEGAKGNPRVAPNLAEFAQRRRDTIARKHL